MKLGKKGGIAIFTLLGLILATVVILHQNLGPAADPMEERAKKIVTCMIIAGACIGFAVLYDKVTGLAGELFQSRHLIWKLAKNDFKKRYAGSYLGKVWAFVQPVVTVLMYWIVFDLIFKTKQQLVANGIDVPYALYLTAGLVPWFFFSEGLSQGTSALIEYNYLVKKVVFNINILPVIKMTAASFTHIFFAFILVVLSCCYGYFPTFYMLQIVYYSFCAFMLTLAINYATSAIVVFFKDLQQIIMIVLQLGMWATPILWDLNMVPGKLAAVISANPLVYIVCGYRDAIYGRVWFFNKPWETLYFWSFTLLMFIFGTSVFNKLKIHFADVM